MQGCRGPHSSFRRAVSKRQAIQALTTLQGDSAHEARTFVAAQAKRTPACESSRSRTSALAAASGPGTRKGVARRSSPGSSVRAGWLYMPGFQRMRNARPVPPSGLSGQGEPAVWGSPLGVVIPLACGFLRIRRPAAALPAAAAARARLSCASEGKWRHARSRQAGQVLRRAVRYGDAPRAALRRARKARRARIPGRATNEEARRNAASVDAGSFECQRIYAAEY